MDEQLCSFTNESPTQKARYRSALIMWMMVTLMVTRMVIVDASSSQTADLLRTKYFENSLDKMNSF